ncbi:hypothetical protein A1019T_02478 [Psychrobacter pasteurii]|uniref:Uncharacterized protein n=1 Tax=Psychrobacter pasteurii TaxID=1945520 RepID=A0A1R4EIZ3_9GAMM|nr:hypothetical protein [Psychrobacter pasteurii]SJM38481.1 hypothetical protein A1019T_02478 [Psychrobacter pasteurii]
MISKILPSVAFAALLALSVGQATAASPSELISLQGDNGQDLPLGDMFILFAWMEDGCVGDGFIYDSIKEHNTKFINRTMKMKMLAEPNENDEIYEFFITPRSQWAPGFSPLMKDVSIHTNHEYTEYHIKFADGVKYREQPIKEYHYKFRPESEGGAHVLKFAKNANMQSVLKHFKTRQTLDYVTGEMFDQKAEFDRNNNTLTCYY